MYASRLIKHDSNSARIRKEKAAWGEMVNEVASKVSTPSTARYRKNELTGRMMQWDSVRGVWL